MKTRNKQRIQIDDLEIGTCMTVFKNHFRAGPDIFAKLPPKKVQAIGFEIALLGQNGLDINNRDKLYHLKELASEFTA